MKTMADALIRNFLEQQYNYYGDYARFDSLAPIRNATIFNLKGNKAELLFYPYDKFVIFRWIEKKENFEKKC